MNYKIVLSIVFMVLFVGIYAAIAQPGPPPPPPDSNPVPITGIEYLIAAGAAFGAKKLYDKKKK
ncbi:hypothetical protein [Marivirga arenosa]|uniref:Uncharacterized protein n=1 Tax=Marivirga arenosa TaxID=3059076 RepID=A0AA49JD94_9BACT|nr:MULTISPECIES: hypothetical protein [unclassified Marivirga]WKK83839.1 hypothetical protein QYS48_16430 [Marivirga sp. ABR2-2]WNB18813.1 hypothetical protein QYS47_31450 [Marivirga sp. BKB1-2]